VRRRKATAWMGSQAEKATMQLILQQRMQEEFGTNHMCSMAQSQARGSADATQFCAAIRHSPIHP
jgi:hypothetical protein